MSDFSGFRCLCGSTLLAVVLASAHVASAAPTTAPAAAAPSTAMPAAAPSGPTAPAASPAPVKVTPELRSAIKELLMAAQAKDGLRNAFQAISQTLPNQMAQLFSSAIQQNPGLTDESRRQVRERLSKSFEPATKEAMTIVQDPKLIDEVMENSYPIYASHFTLDEIRQLTAFYKSPIGAKSIKVMPQVMNESMRSGMATIQPRISAIMERTLKKELDAVQPK